MCLHVKRAAGGRRWRSHLLRARDQRIRSGHGMSLIALVALGVLRSAPLRASLSRQCRRARGAARRRPNSGRTVCVLQEVTVTIGDLSSLGDGVGGACLRPTRACADGDAPRLGRDGAVTYARRDGARARLPQPQGLSVPTCSRWSARRRRLRTEPRCAPSACGGCQYQHVEHAEQLRMKARHVSILARTGGLDVAAVADRLAEELGCFLELTPQYNVERRDGERPAVGFVQAHALADGRRGALRDRTDGINAALPAARKGRRAWRRRSPPSARREARARRVGAAARRVRRRRHRSPRLGERGERRAGRLPCLPPHRSPLTLTTHRTGGAARRRRRASPQVPGGRLLPEQPVRPPRPRRLRRRPGERAAPRAAARRRAAGLDGAGAAPD